VSSLHDSADARGEAAAVPIFARSHEAFVAATTTGAPLSGYLLKKYIVALEKAQLARCEAKRLSGPNRVAALETEPKENRPHVSMNINTRGHQLTVANLDHRKAKALQVEVAMEMVEAAGIEPASVDPLQSGLHA